MGARPPVALRLKHAAVFPQYRHLVDQSLKLPQRRVFVHADRPICGHQPYLLLQQLVDQVSHVQLSFCSVEKMTASEAILVDNEPLAIVSAALVPVHFTVKPKQS